MFVFSMLMLNFLNVNKFWARIALKKEGHKSTPAFTSMNSYIPFSAFRFEVVQQKSKGNLGLNDLFFFTI